MYFIAVACAANIVLDYLLFEVLNTIRYLRALDMPLDTVTLERSPASRIVWMDAPLKIVDSQDMEAPIRELDQSQAEAVVFLGKVGLGISSEHLQAPEQYKKILEYIEKHNMQITGFSREITLIDYGFTNDPEKFVFRSSHICGMSVVWIFWCKSIHFFADRGSGSDRDGNRLS